MKCQNCGNNKASYHYRAIINGQKTEQHLCAECAEKLGNDEGEFFGSMDMMMNDFVRDFFGGPAWGMTPAFGRMMIPTIILPRLEFTVNTDEEKPDTSEKVTAKAAPAATDEEFIKRREINVLREQMNAAVKAEEFEKAAQLRDRLRELQ